VAGSRVDLGRTGLGVAVRKGASPPDVSTADALMGDQPCVLLRR
jgi:hypothetical protein